MGNGVCVIGRDDRMGLGSMTADFCQGMQPDRLVLVDVGSRKGKITIPKESYGEIVRVPRNSIPDGYLTSILRDMQVVVGFETWYWPQLPTIARSMGGKTVLFPMWEWSSDRDCGNSDYLLCLSETDYRKYWCRPMPRVTRIKCDWPACSEIHDPNRQLNWPPKNFVHIAGNASHNRDGTKEVLQAAKHLVGAGATLRINAGFNYSNWCPEEMKKSSPYEGMRLELEAGFPTRKDLFANCDCLVQPRRLGGHSLPINEAMGEGIPVLTLDLPDWQNNPYRIPAWKQPQERFGPGMCDVWSASPDELGWWMRGMALGNIAKAEGPKLPTWDEFREWWGRNIK